MDGPQRGAAPTGADAPRSDPNTDDPNTDDTVTDDPNTDNTVTERHREVRMPADDEARRPDPAGAAARSMTQLAQQMRDMAERLLSGALPGWPLPGAAGTGTSSGSGAAAT